MHVETQQPQIKKLSTQELSNDRKVLIHSDTI